MNSLRFAEYIPTGMGHPLTQQMSGTLGDRLTSPVSGVCPGTISGEYAQPHDTTRTTSSFSILGHHASHYTHPSRFVTKLMFSTSSDSILLQFALNFTSWELDFTLKIFIAQNNSRSLISSDFTLISFDLTTWDPWFHTWNFYFFI